MPKYIDPDDIEWSRYPYVASNEHARDWIRLNASLGRSTETVDTYARGLNGFLAFCDRVHLHPQQMTRSEAVQYAFDLKDRPGKSRRFAAGMSYATVYRRLAIVHAFFDFLVTEGARDDNPLGRDRSLPHTSFGTRTRSMFRPPLRTRPWIPSDEQWCTYLQAAAQAPVPTYCMVVVAFVTGLRTAELCGVRTDDFDVDGELLRVRADTAKAGQEYFVSYTGVAGELLHPYLEHRTTLTTLPGPLFLSESPGTYAQPITVRMWSRTVRQLALQVELPHFTTHTFRQLSAAYFNPDSRFSAYGWRANWI